jgi:hypothetical protein
MAKHVGVQLALELFPAGLQSYLPRLRDQTPIMLLRLGLAAPPSGQAPRLPVDSLLTVTQR